MKLPTERLAQFFDRGIKLYHSADKAVGGFGRAVKHVIAAVMLYQLTMVGLGIGLGTVRQVQINTAGPSVAYHMSQPMAALTATAALDVVQAVKFDPQLVKASQDWATMTKAEKLATLEKVQARYLSHFQGVPDLPMVVDKLPGAYGMVDNPFASIIAGAIRTDVTAAVQIDDALTFGPRSDFNSAVNTVVHESMHVVQMTWLARAMLDQLQSDDPKAVAAIVGMVSEQTTGPQADSARDTMIAALKPIAATVAPPAEMQPDLQRWLQDFSDPMRRLLYGYYLNAGEQQSFKVADTMTETMKLDAKKLAEIGPANLRAAFIETAQHYRPGNAFGPARTVYPKVLKTIIANQPSRAPRN